MTIEQLQALLDTVNDTQNRLVSLMTALALAIELFDDLLPEDHAVLLAAWQQQLHALHRLPAGLPTPPGGPDLSGAG